MPNTTVWNEYPVPPMCVEAHFGDRLIRCFADRPRSFDAMLSAAVASNPDNEALVCEDRRWTYRELDDQVDSIAAALAARGIGSGDRVLLFLRNRSEFIFMLFAVQRIGAIAVPVGTREQRPALTYIVNQCGARAIAFDSALAERIPAIDDTPALLLRICMDEPVDGAETLAQLKAGYAGKIPAFVPSEEDTAVILYTSGTTGNPKGARLTHLGIAHSAMHFAACFKLHAGDRAALAVPASHVTGLIAIIATMMHVGGTTLIVAEFKAVNFIAYAARERMTYTLMVPAMYNLCLLQPDLAAHDLGPWRIGGFGGAPMPVSTIDSLAVRLPGLTLINAYGATETTSPVTAMPFGLIAAHGDSVGLALPCADVHVMDDDGCELPPGSTGELWIGGPMVVPGYWNDAAATAREFTAGYWHSGDIGSVDEQGFVRILDRKKDMINRGGFKIYSAEVENILLTLPGVVEAAIVGRPCPVLGERVHAFIHVSVADLDTEAVRVYCAQRLADYKVPETVTFSHDPLPRNANGKLLKRLLRDGVT